jgi:glutamate dehydrogenase/leucine dehydrogenase
MNIAIIGFGTVGQGLVEILLEKGDDLRRSYQLDLRVVAVCDARLGSIGSQGGVDLAALLEAARRGSFGDYADAPGLWRDRDNLAVIRDGGADAASPAGDEGNLVLKLHERSPSGGIIPARGEALMRYKHRSILAAKEA